MSCCTKNCCKNKTCSLSLSEVEDFLYKVKLKIEENSCGKISEYLYGYDCDKDSQDLFTVKEVLEKYIKDINRKGESCICAEDIQKMVQNIELTKKVQRDRKDFEVSRHNELKWIYDHPYCVGKEKWKLVANRICREIGVEITSEEIKCDFTLDVKIEAIDCDILHTLSVAEESCKQNVIIDRNDQECKIDHKLLLEKHPHGPDLSLYKIAVNKHKLTYDMIQEIYSKGLSLGLNKLGNCTLNTQISSYDLTEIKFKEIFLKP